MRHSIIVAAKSTLLQKIRQFSFGTLNLVNTNPLDDDAQVLAVMHHIDHHHGSDPASEGLLRVGGAGYLDVVH